LQAKREKTAPALSFPSLRYFSKPKKASCRKMTPPALARSDAAETKGLKASREGKRFRIEGRLAPFLFKRRMSKLPQLPKILEPQAQISGKSQKSAKSSAKNFPPCYLSFMNKRAEAVF
jgi:hypothetical protein